MKTNMLLTISKIFACINLLCALGVFYVLIVVIAGANQYSNTMHVPDALPFHRLLPLMLFGIFILTGSVLFLQNKKVGWWIVILVAVYVSINGFFVGILKIDTPYFFTNSTTNFGLVFYIYSVISVFIYLTNPVRKHFKIFTPKVTPV